MKQAPPPPPDVSTQIDGHLRRSRPPLPWRGFISSLVFLLAGSTRMIAAAEVDAVAVTLPAGIRAVWETGKAFRETTPTRERICLNGLWRWQPAEAPPTVVPERRWGFFKVPGCWPGLTDYMQKDSQTVYAHPAWEKVRLGSVKMAWSERTFDVPAAWAGRRLTLTAEHLNSHATVFIDGQRVGEMRFPGGEVDLTQHVRPGATHRLSLGVSALPLKGVALSYTDSAAAREVQGTVARRGLCGDVFLVSTPAGPRLGHVQVETSVRRRELVLRASLDGLSADARYQLRAVVSREARSVQEFTSPVFAAKDLTDGRLSFGGSWLPEDPWDLHTPDRTHELVVTLLDASGQTLDAGWTERFGFREFWIEGRDFFLNGTRVHLSAVPLDNAQVGAAWATYGAARESLERLKSFGINYVYTHHYSCVPGAHLGFEEILRAADDVGMLVGLTQPHFSDYDWAGPGAEATNGYAGHARFYVQAAGNHPSVVFYPMSHNATGYNEDMNPDLIDGRQAPRDTWAERNAKSALRAEAIVRRLDPGRIVYHHASGHLGVMHNSNFYPNFTPIQELCDWFEHWATHGIKPAFTCEYGAPFSWDWTMYRGWYKGEREFGSARVPWEFCLAEWNASFLGDRAFAISEAERANLRWEARQYRAGNLWHRWDYPSPIGSDRFDERYPIFARYLEANWRAYRTWGLSGNSPWEYGHFWKLRPGVDRSRRTLPVDWDKLQRPGFSPDYEDQRYERMDLAFARSDWIPTPAAEALLRNNRPLLAYLAGKPGAFTSQDHNFFPGEIIEKQIVVINDSRVPQPCQVEWSFGPQAGETGFRAKSGQPISLTVAPGDQARVPVRVTLPRTGEAGRRAFRILASFRDGEVQEDTFAIDVLPLPPSSASKQASAAGEPGQTRPPGRFKDRTALFDPRGETGSVLDALGLSYQRVEAGSDLAPFDLLVVGKEALTPEGQAPDITRVRDGLKVIVFEQTAAVLERRFGFRVAEYGLRQVFPRLPDHPALRGLQEGHLCDWRGSATILPPRLSYELRPRHGPTVTWCGLPVTRAWRCGNRGNVASVLIEKPTRGDFLPVLDGGFGLQYSPLLEYREGRGLVLFCQLDVTGRTEPEPAALTLLDNLLGYASAWQPSSRREALYAGPNAGQAHLESSGIRARPFRADELTGDRTLVVAAGAGSKLSNHADAIRKWLEAGGRLLAVGLDEAELSRFLRGQFKLKRAEHISTWFEPPAIRSPLGGIGPADVHNRDPRAIPLLTGGASAVGNGVLGMSPDGSVVLCQMAPWDFGPSEQANLRRTHRRVSFLFNRLLANLGVGGEVPLLDRFRRPAAMEPAEARWHSGFYLDQPQEWDDPYRFFRW